MGIRSSLRNWAERRSEKIQKRYDDKMHSAWMDHGEPFMGFESKPIKETSGKYLIFRDSLKNGHVKFTVSDHMDPGKEIASVKIALNSGSGIVIHQASSKPFFRGYSDKKFEAYGEMAGALGEAVNAHTESRIGRSAPRELLTNLIFDKMVESEIDCQRREFVAKKFLEDKKVLDKFLENGLSHEDYRRGLVESENSANEKFSQKLLKEAEKFEKKIRKGK